MKKFDPDGNLLWDAGSEGTFYDFASIGNSLWLSGSVSAMGQVVGDSVFNGEITSGALFLAQLDMDGNFGLVEFIPTWAAQANYVSLFLEADSYGDLYLVGNIMDPTYFRDSIINYWPNEIFLMKIDTNMNVKWLHHKDISANIWIEDFVKANDNQFYLYGYFRDSLAIEGIKLDGEPDSWTYFLADFDSDGVFANAYDYEDPLGNFLLGPSGTLYTTSYVNYDHWLHKKTLSGAESWNINIWNNGGDASMHFTMDIDEDGNLYAQGFYRGTVDFFGTQIKGRGIFFMKFRNNGTVEWFKTMENSDGYSYGIKVDNEGNVYAWGGFADFIRMEGLEYTNTDPGGRDIYLVKLDRDGQLKYIKQFDGKGIVYGWGGMDLTPENDIVITGSFSDTLVFGAYTLTEERENYWDVFVTKINSSGNILWARSYAGWYYSWGRSVASDSSGNVYITGAFRDSIKFDTVMFTHPNGAYDMFLTKLDPKGNLIWAKRGGPDNYYLRGHAITIDGDNVFVQGIAQTRLNYQPNISFGENVFTSEFEQNNFLTCYSTSGEFNWAKIFKINNFSWPNYKIDTDPQGNIYAGGVFRDTIVVESNLVVGSGAEDFYITKFSPDGEFKWMKTSEKSSKGQLDLYSLAVFEEDVVLVGGTLIDGSVEIAGEVIRTASQASYAALLGEDIIGCVIDLKVTTVDEDFGMGNGTADLTITGGTAPYQIAWTTGEVGPSRIDSLSAGSYQVTVIDDKGCEQFGLFSINIANGPVVTLKTSGDVSCHGASDGFIDIDVSGGSMPYTYAWDNGYHTEDLINLQAAPYSVTVTDAEGLFVSKEFTIKEPKPLDVSYTITEASCGGFSDGSIEVFTSGGTKPYDWEWNTGVFTESLTGEKAGKYTLTVLDANNCELKAEIALSEKNAPIVETEFVEPATCEVADGSAKVRVINGIGNISFLWSDASGTSVPELTGQRARGYFVTVTNEAGCKTIHLVDIPEKKPVENKICVVTVDTVIGSNLVVWEKVEDAIIYHVYRETSAKDVYLLAGSVPGGDLSVFVDTVANPTIRSYRYKIAAVDECGTESFLSHMHKTVHLQIYPGLTESIMNLAWDDYIGETFESFEVWRFTSLFSWEMLDELPSNLKSYTDFNVPPGKVFYNVRVPIPNPCNPTGLFKSGGYKGGTGPYKHSLSNMDDNKLKETGVGRYMSDKFYVYPNPTPGHVVVWSENFNITEGEILVTDLSGRRVMHKKFENNLSGRLELDLTGQSSGSYLVQLWTNGQVYFQKLVKQ